MNRVTILLLSCAAAFAQSDSKAPMMVIEMKPGDTHLTNITPPEGKLARWVTLETASITTRYRFLENSERSIVANQQQYQIALGGDLNVDAAGRFHVHAGLFTGNSFSGGWSATGLGTGQAQSNLYLKQLSVVARPVSGVEFQFGGLDFARGESTEITSYDADGYVVGERLSVRRPGMFYVDEISVTAGYVGDFNRAGVVHRLRRLGESNYHQVLLTKQFRHRVRASADYTSDSGEDTFRQGLTLRLPEMRVAEMLHFENYERVGVNLAYGFAAYGEQKIMKRFSLGAGYTEHDRHARLYADRFAAGRYAFFNAHVALGASWSIIVLYTQAIETQLATAARLRSF